MIDVALLDHVYKGRVWSVMDKTWEPEKIVLGYPATEPPSVVTSRIRDLERAGLVEQCPGGSRWTLTPAGRDAAGIC